MIAQSRNYYGDATPCSPQEFDQIVEDKEGTIFNNCAKYQQLKPLLRELKSQGKHEEAKKVDEEIKRIKKSHPVFCFLGTFENNKRKKESILPNGLVFIDIDQDENEELMKEGLDPLIQRIKEKDPEFYETRLVLAHKTWSGTGLRYIFKADHSMTYLKNIEWFESTFGVKADDACKDLARASFAVPRDYIFKFSDELFTYNNPLTNAEFGGDNNETTLQLWYDNNTYSLKDYKCKQTHAIKQVKKEVGESIKMNENANTSSTTHVSINCYGAMANVERNEEGEPILKGIPYREYARCLMDKLGGIPSLGERNVRINQWAWHFRNICENDVNFMVDMVRPLANGLPEGEIANACISATSKEYFNSTLMREVREEVEAQRQNNLSYEEIAKQKDLIDYDYWNRRFGEIKLPKGLKESVCGVQERLRPLAALVALSPIFTLMTRVSAEYRYKLIRLNNVTFVVGESTSGKSFVRDLSQLWCGGLRELDKKGRKEEDEWKSERDRLGNNVKMDKKRPKEVIRYLPSKVSDAQLLERMHNAVEMVPTLTETGEPGPAEEMHLHLITVESDGAALDDALRSPYSNYRNFLLKSFDNEDGGVDFKYEQSSNGSVEVCWNTVYAGVWDTLWHFCNTLSSGIEYRMVLCPMPSPRIEIWKADELIRTPEEEAAIREVAEQIGGKDNPFWGPVCAPELMEEMEKWHDEKKCESLLNGGDLEYFQLSHRNKQKAFLAGIAFAILEQRDNFFQLPIVKLKNGSWARRLEVSEDTIKFARFVADFCVDTEDAIIKKKKHESKNYTNGAPTPRSGLSKMSNKTMVLYNKLPDSFTFSDFKNYNSGITSRSTLTSTLQRWRDAQILTYDEEEKVYRKVKSDAGVSMPLR